MTCRCCAGTLFFSAMERFEPVSAIKVFIIATGVNSGYFMFGLALSNLSQRKMRSAISILALSVGICLFMVLWGLVNGVLNEFTERIRGIGADITVVRSGSNPLLFGSGVLPYKLGEQLREIDGVQTVSPVLIWKTQIGGAPYNVFGIETG